MPRLFGDRALTRAAGSGGPGAVAGARAAPLLSAAEADRLTDATTRRELQALREKVQTLDNRLYGGSVRNPKELESLHSELEYARQ